jgi:hypothetical protein
MMRFLLATPALFFALHAGAECSFDDRPGAAPQLPNGSTASAAELSEAQVAVQQYLQQGNDYLDCGVMNRRQHNQLLARMEVLNETFQRELNAFQSRALADGRAPSGDLLAEK